MKKIFLLSVAVTVIFAACQKESDPVQQENKVTSLTASIEQQVDPSATKTALGSGNTVVWSTGDAVKIWNGTSNDSTSYSLTSGAGTTSGRFSGTDITNPQYAFYPASAVTAVSGSSVTFTLPATQSYADNTFANGANIAVAQISGGNMSFKNVCGVLKLQLKGTAMVKSIVVRGSASEKLNGEYTVNAADATPNMPCGTASTDSEKSITLDCGTGVQLNTATATNFYIVIPKGAFANGFNVKVTEFYSGSENISATNNTINRNTILSMPEKSITVKGYLLPGEFSVSATKKVRFARGNLKVSVDAQGKPLSWGFHEHQYDALTNSGANITLGTAAGDLDLFGTSTDSTGAGLGYKPWGVNKSESSGDYAGAFVSWTENTDLQSALGDYWYLLTSAEMDYLINSRSASTIGTETSARFAEVIINGIYGLLLFPDSFTWNTTTMGTAPTTFNTHHATWNDVNYTLAQFGSMADAGCVFLPVATERIGCKIVNLDYGYYALNKIDDSINTPILRFNNENVFVTTLGSNFWQYGHAVRLAYVVE